ncbi:Glyoxalase-like domain-containing protein [Micromonospora citrea]|uniref:Glyoxalase-like domain-containing protein n=1 Tax=Micromonospora citrea TaxID=47855 RepID=A0A1C6V618_9ACTN|nr:VOC family protein [Micromonospora citrea]SCL61494.1 Glyoxalase-like domain-containing protein [Micromonospora citrea]
MNTEYAADIDYIDHTVLITTDLTAASARYAALGFTLSPVSPHHLAERPGGPLLPTCTANRCAYFGQSFIELLGIVDPAAPDPWGVHQLRQTYRGLLMTLGSRDVQATAERLRAAGLASTGIRALQREVSTPDGPRTVRADSVRIDAAHTPEGALQATQHFTPQYVHQPRYLDHPNGAVGLHSVLLVAPDDEVDGHEERYARILDADVWIEGPKRVIHLRHGRVEIIPQSSLDDVLPGHALPGLPLLAAHTVAVRDLTAARKLIEHNEISTHTTPEGFYVTAEDAYGVPLAFTQV